MRMTPRLTRQPALDLPAARTAPHWAVIARYAADGLWPEWSRYLAQRWTRLTRTRR